MGAKFNFRSSIEHNDKVLEEHQIKRDEFAICFEDEDDTVLSLTICIIKKNFVLDVVKTLNSDSILVNKYNDLIFGDSDK